MEFKRKFVVDDIITFLLGMGFIDADVTEVLTTPNSVAIFVGGWPEDIVQKMIELTSSEFHVQVTDDTNNDIIVFSNSTSETEVVKWLI